MSLSVSIVIPVFNEVENVDTLVLAYPHRSEDSLSESLHAAGIETLAFGDCISPRTAEEAIYEGMVAATELL